MKNPFIVSGYEGQDYFCDREDESARLTEAALNGRSIVLTSIRRLGKTGLIKFSQDKLKSRFGIETIYIDIMPTTDLVSFTNIFAKSVFEQSFKFNKKTLLKIKNFLSGITPSITFDSLTGQPSLEIKITRKQEAVNTLDGIFGYINKDGRQFHIAIDEFQQITDYPEKNIEAILRSNIQQLKNATFIFSGSKKHILSDMFSEGKRPFYNSSEFFELNYINLIKYKDFISKHFSESNIKIDEADIFYILDKTRRHTYFTQYLCNKLFASAYKVITKKEIDKTILQIIRDNETIYHNYRNFLTNNQWQLLKSIAAENGVEEPTSGEFIRNHNLPGASSVSVAVKSLIDKELIFFESDKYFISDVFFGLWLKSL